MAALPDVEMNLESSQPSSNTTTPTTTTQPRRSSRLADKKSGQNATPPDVGNNSTQKTQLEQPEGSKMDPRAGSNATTEENIMGPPHHSIDMRESVQQPPQAHKKNQRAALNKPSSRYLSEEQRENYMKICVPLHSAALRGDWHAAEGIITKYPKVINMSITQKEDTVLHIVSSTKHIHFAQKLVNKMEVEDLELQNKEGQTALWLAVASTDKMVDVLLKRNKDLLKIRTKGCLPLMCAVWSGHKDVLEYIYSKTDIAAEEWKEKDKRNILNSCIAAGLFGKN